MSRSSPLFAETQDSSQMGVLINSRLRVMHFGLGERKRKGTQGQHDSRLWLRVHPQESRTLKPPESFLSIPKGILGYFTSLRHILGTYLMEKATFIVSHLSLSLPVLFLPGAAAPAALPAHTR